MTSRTETDAWDRHWTSYAQTNALNPAQVLRRSLVFQALDLSNHRGPVRLLDLGSGTGEFASEVMVARPDAEVVGLDLSLTGVELAQAKVPKGRFFQQDFSKPMSLDKSLEGFATHVTCSEVLEHLDNPGAALRAVRPYLAPGCKVVITVPAGPMSTFDRHIGHRRHFDRSRLAGLLEGAGYEEVAVHGAGFPFFNLYRLTVVARGKALIKDASAQDEGKGLPGPAQAAIRAFSTLFKLNSRTSERGWQLVATGYVPGG
jgi:SAM-dependent methyltransferase